MSGIDFARSDSRFACELVLKDEFTFQIPALEIFPKAWGGRDNPYNRGYGCTSGIFKPLPFADLNFGKISDPLQTNGRKCLKIYTLKCRKMIF